MSEENNNEEVEQEVVVSEELSTEQIAELQEKAKQVEALEAQLKEKEEALDKLSKKDINFKRLRTASKEEKERLLEKFNEKEKAFAEEINSINERLAGAEEARMDDARKRFMTAIGADDALEKKIEDAVKNSVAYLGAPSSPQEVYERYQRAYGLVKDNSAKVSPLHSFTPTTTYMEDPDRGKKRYSETVEGKKNLNQWFGDKIFPKEDKK